MTALTTLLEQWLPTQRWFGGKGTAITSVELERETPMEGGSGSGLAHVLLTVHGPDTDARYQLLLGRLEGPAPQRFAHATIGEADGNTWYDAAHDQEAADLLLRRIAAAESVDGLGFHRLAEIELGHPSRVVGAEQSNTSLIYGEKYILKLFRRLQPGLNPDLELSRALVGNPHVAQPLGWIEGEVGGEATTLGLLQCFQRHATEGWAMATASVRDLFAEGDLHADEVGGDFAAESERLGAATAEVHQALREALPSKTVGPEQIASATRQLHERLDAALTVVPDLEPHAEALRASYDAVAELSASVPVQRVHGDYHLGQVLRTQTGWVLLDFEGEPARPLAERTALMSPLRDVAGMLRSYDYAARHLLAERGGDAQLAYRASEWAERNRQAFCDGYARAAGADPRDDAVLLRAFELDKAVYEVVYEARNRPTWVQIPVGSIERLARNAPNRTAP